MSHVAVADVNGADARRLGAGTDPSVSPDGHWVAYILKTGRASTTIRFHSLGGAGDWNVWVPYPIASDPVWAPGSARIALTIDRYPAGGVVLIAAHPGARPRVLLRAAVATVGFSPTGSSLVYGLGNGGIAVQSASGGHARVLARRGTNPLWTPLGIVYSGAGDLWIVQPSGSDGHRLTHTNSRPGLVPVAASASGTHLLAEQPPSNNGRLWAVDLPSGAARPLTDWRGGMSGVAISRNGRTVLGIDGCGEAAGVSGVAFSKPFAGGRALILARDVCDAAWND
jgi:Tol biopolymer transport system component